MPTQDLYQEAIKYAGEAHKNQLVPGTESNYLLHLSNVAMEVMFAHFHKQNFDLNFTVQIALLHDIVEDTDVNYQELSEKFNYKIANGVLALSKDKTLDKVNQLSDSLKRILKEPKEVGIVKLADRITNLQKPPAHWSPEKKKTYLKQAMEIHSNLGKNNEYLSNRLINKIEKYKFHTI